MKANYIAPLFQYVPVLVSK